MNEVNQTIANSKARQKFNEALKVFTSCTGEDMEYVGSCAVARCVYNSFLLEAGMNAGDGGEFMLLQDPLPYNATWEQVADAMQELSEICFGE
jgi:hypothetical protein